MLIWNILKHVTYEDPDRNSFPRCLWYCLVSLQPFSTKFFTIQWDPTKFAIVLFMLLVKQN